MKIDSQNDKPLRVLQVTPRYFPLMGGVETHVYEVSRRLARAGLEVTTLTTDPTGQLTRQETIDGVKIERVRAWPARQDFYFSPSIYKVILNGGWDIVHCQGVHTLVPLLAMAAAWKAKIPYVLTFHTGGHTSRLRNYLRGGQWWLLRPLLAQAKFLIGVSQFEATYFQEILKLPANRFKVIRNGGRLPEIPVGVGPNPPTEDAPLIISTGRLERYKGHHRLISALPEIHKTYKNARLLILGSGPFEAQLHALVRKLGLSGFVEIKAIPAEERQQMAETLAGSSLVALMSEYEAHPIAVMEALALKRPVLVADTSGLHELAEQGLVRAIPLNSPPYEIANAIKDQLQNPLIPPKVGFPTWENCTEELLEVYQEAIRK